MTMFHNIFIGALVFTSVGSLIVPDEITSLLSLIYSNIPPIRKGTDSRLGLGFRLGQNADFQVLLELGPQTNTQPIGNTADSKRRRNSDGGSVGAMALPVANKADSKKRYAAPGGSVDKISNSWLENWRSTLLRMGNQQKPSDASAVLPQRRVSEPSRKAMRKEDMDVTSHLHQLYNNSNATSSNTNTTDTS